MRYKQQLSRFASILLIIVLVQKMGGGLYLHNCLHDSKNIVFLSQDTTIISQAACSCIDDFNVPFTEPVSFFIDHPASIKADYFAVAEFPLPLIPEFFHSLRGPPVS